jgi:hypothetical protein
VDRCAVFVDAGYVLADGAMAVHGTRHRESVSWDYAGLVKLLTGLSRDRTGLPVLRCYWYEATVEGRRSSEHNALADLPGVKLRLGRVRPGRREGVEAEMHRDLATLARNRAVSDAVIVSAEEDLAEVVAEVQDFGLRVLAMHITADGNWTVSRPLRQECDDIVEISGAHLRPFVDLIPGAESPGRDDQYRNGSYPARGHERRGMANGHGAGLGAVTHQGLPAAALPGPPAIYTAPVVEEYQRTAQPPAQGQGPLASPGLPADAAGPPSSGSHAARRDPAGSPPAPDQRASPNRAARRDASRDAAGAQDPAGAQAPTAPLAAAPQAARQAPSQAAHQAPAAHQAQDVAQFRAAAPGPVPSQSPAASPGPPPQPAAAPGPPAGYGAPPADHAGAHVLAHGNPGRRGSAGPQASAPEAVSPTPLSQTPVPPAPAPSAPAPQAPLPQTSVPQTSVPPDPLPRRPVLQAPVPQNPVPQNPLQQDPVQPSPVAQAPVPPAPMPPAAPAPGPGDIRFGAGQGDYRVPESPGPRAAPAREAMAGRNPEASRPAGPAAQFPENAPPGRFAGDPAQGRFADGAPPGRFPEDQAPGRFAEGPGPAPYPSAPPGAYGGGGAAQAPYSQFPGSASGQHAAPGPESGYLGPPHEQGPYSEPQSAAHANLPQPVSPPTTVSLTDAVQAAHAEGFGFGDAVARDAPALWLEAVLARKPRMPSDLEARLLQGSALPIDSLLHDEVRQSLRRGFWDALERSRR